MHTYLFFDLVCCQIVLPSGSCMSLTFLDDAIYQILFFSIACLHIQYCQEITWQKPHPRRGQTASRPRLLAPADASCLRPARVSTAIAVAGGPQALCIGFSPAGKRTQLTKNFGSRRKISTLYENHLRIILLYSNNRKHKFLK